MNKTSYLLFLIINITFSHQLHAMNRQYYKEPTCVAGILFFKQENDKLKVLLESSRNNLQKSRLVTALCNTEEYEEPLYVAIDKLTRKNIPKTSTIQKIYSCPTLESLYLEHGTTKMHIFPVYGNIDFSRRPSPMRWYNIETETDKSDECTKAFFKVHKSNLKKLAKKGSSHEKTLLSLERAVQ